MRGKGKLWTGWPPGASDSKGRTLSHFHLLHSGARFMVGLIAGLMGSEGSSILYFPLGFVYTNLGLQAHIPWE